MSFFQQKLNLKTKLNSASNDSQARYDFLIENHTPDYFFDTSAVDIVTNTISIPSDIIFDELQRFYIDTDDTLPQPLNNYSQYYVRNFTSGTSANTFQISTSESNPIIDLTTSGAGTHQIKAIIILDKYRLVSYHNIRWDKSSMGCHTQGSNTTSGSTAGNISFSIADEKSYNTPEYPPRIWPLDGRFTFRNRCIFGTGGYFIGQGSSFSGFYYNLRHASSWPFLTYETNGKLEYELGNSYSSTEATEYEDNPSFILEYNPIDPYDQNSSNWETYTEYIDANTEDPNTGTHPYGNIIKDQTTVDHCAVHADRDTTIRFNAPNSNFGSNTTLDLWNDAGIGSDIRRTMLHFDVSHITTSAVGWAEAWVFASNSNSTFDDLVDIVALSGDFNETSATWNNSEYLFNGDLIGTRDGSIIPGDAWRDGFIPTNIPVSAVDLWINNPAENYGIGIKYNSEGSFVENSPTFISREDSSYFKRPFLAVSYYGTSGGYDINAYQESRNLISSQILIPEVSYDMNFSILNSVVSADMVSVAFAGNPNVSANADVSWVSAYMPEPYIGTTSGLPFDVSATFIESVMLDPSVYLVFNESATEDISLVKSQMLQPYITSEVIYPTIVFGVPTPISKTAILPSGTILVRVDAYNHNPLPYTSIGLTPNSLSGATIVSAWQVGLLSAAALIEISATESTIGILEVSAENDLGTVSISADYDYTFVTSTSAIDPIIIITNDPSNKIIDPDPVYAYIQVISPGFIELNSFGLMADSIGTIVSGGYSNPLIPYPNLNYIIEISGTGNLYVSADDIYGNSVSAEDGTYIKYEKRYGVTCSGREIDLVNFLPNHLKNGQVGTFIKFFEDFLNNMYYCQNEFRGSSATSGDEYKISILEKIFRLSYLHDPDLVDLEYIQFFANYLGYDINISRGDIGNLANVDLTSVNTVGDDPNNDIYESELSRRYLRFAIRNLPTWYRIKTTRNAIKVMLFSFGLVGDILTNFTAPIAKGGYDNDDTKWLTFDDRYTDSSMSSQIPETWFGTPHFSIAVDYDNSPVNWFKQLPMIIDAIESIRPINTVLDEISTTLKRRVFPIHIRAASRLNSTSYHSVSASIEPVDESFYLEDNNSNIIIDENDNRIIYM